MLHLQAILFCYGFFSSFIVNPVGKILRNYKVKDEYANQMKINLHLQNIKLLNGMNYYKTKKDHLNDLLIATGKKQPPKPRKKKINWFWKK